MADAYGKKPLWQWIGIYLVIGLVVYGAIYYFYMRKSGGSGTTSSGYSYSYASPAASTMSAVAPTTGTTTASDNIYTTRTDPAKGKYMADFAGMTLYVFDKDTTGVSNCEGSCLKAWPAYTSGATSQGTFPANISVITRTDGTKQFAWMGKPLYYYANDAAPGDVTGDGVNNTWHLVKL